MIQLRTIHVIRLSVVLEEADIGVLNLVSPSLLSEFTGSLDSSFGTVLLQVFVRLYFSTDEVALDAVEHG
jgi:hypothetical protein